MAEKITGVWLAQIWSKHYANETTWSRDGSAAWDALAEELNQRFFSNEVLDRYPDEIKKWLNIPVTPKREYHPPTLIEGSEHIKKVSFTIGDYAVDLGIKDRSVCTCGPNTLVHFPDCPLAK